MSGAEGAGGAGGAGEAGEAGLSFVSAWSEAGVSLSAAQHSWRGSESVEGKLFLEIFWQIIG